MSTSGWPVRSAELFQNRKLSLMQQNLRVSVGYLSAVQTMIQRAPYFASKVLNHPDVVG